MSASSERIDIAIVGGAGHVGLPLAILLASRGRNVLIYDINAAALEQIGRGVMPFIDEGAEPLLQEVLATGRLSMSTNCADLARVRQIVVTVGTPVDEFLNPSLNDLTKCFDAMLPHLNDDQLIVLRSTVYPGVTEWLARYLRSKGKMTKLAFCPERVAQGFALEELQQLPQIVSGTTPQAADEAEALFRLCTSEIIHLTPKEAEFAKLFNNTYRYVLFAVANQFFMIADAAGVDYHRVLDAMRTNYPRSRDIPRPGFAAGPCLFKDTMQLSAFCGNKFSVGHAAMLVNEGMPFYIVEKMERDYDLSTMTVGLLGMAFKPDSDDARSSLSYKLKKTLKSKARAVLTTDPHVKGDRDLLPLQEVIAKSDILVLCVPHTVYGDLDCGAKPVVDISNSLPRFAHA